MGDPPGTYRGYCKLESSQHRSALMAMRSVNTGLASPSPPPAFASMNSAQYSSLMEKSHPPEGAGSHGTDETEEESDSIAGYSSDLEISNDGQNSDDASVPEKRETEESSAEFNEDDDMSYYQLQQVNSQVSSTLRLPMVAAVRTTSLDTEAKPVAPLSPSQVQDFDMEECAPHTRRLMERLAAADSTNYMKSAPSWENHRENNHASSLNDSMLSDGDLYTVSPSQIENFYMERTSQSGPSTDLSRRFESENSSPKEPSDRESSSDKSSVVSGGSHTENTPFPGELLANRGRSNSLDSALTDDFHYMERAPILDDGHETSSYNFSHGDSVLTDERSKEHALSLDDTVISRDMYLESTPLTHNEPTTRRTSGPSLDPLSDDLYRETSTPLSGGGNQDRGLSWDNTLLSEDLYIEDSVHPRLRNIPMSSWIPRAAASEDVHKKNIFRRRPSTRRTSNYSLEGSAAALNEQLNDFTMQLRDENSSDRSSHPPAHRRTIKVRNSSTREKVRNSPTREIVQQQLPPGPPITGSARSKAATAPLSIVGYADDSTIGSRDGLSWLRAGDGLGSPFPELEDAPQTQLPGLRRQGFPVGLVQDIKKIPLRFYVVNNSRSMNTPDALQVLFDTRVKNTDISDSSHHDYTSVIPTRRWAALQGSMTDHIALAGMIQVATVFRMVNDPGVYAGPQELSIGGLASFLFLDTESGDRDLKKIDEDVEQAIGTIHRSQPKGAQRPLASHLLEFRNRIRAVEDQLQRQRKQAAIVLTTDGLPTNESGEPSLAAREEFNEALRSLQYLPIRIIVRLCTNDENVVEYYSDFEKVPDLQLIVVNDFMDEAKEVYMHNPWLNYAIPLHRFREMGCQRELFDALHKRQLTKDELVGFLHLLFGEEAMLNAPDIHKNWKRFRSFLSSLNQAEGKHWRAHTRKCEFWIDMDQLEQVYRKSTRRRWFFPSLFRRKSKRSV